MPRYEQLGEALGQLPLAQLVCLLDGAGTWRFENGRLSIMLDDGSSLLFELADPY